MKLSLIVENEGEVILTDQNYLGAGGQASVYVKDKTAYKIYHDPKNMPPTDKLQKLSKIGHNNVIKPKNIVRRGNNSIGYTMEYVKNTHPLCKLFTQSFKQANNIGKEDIVKLVKEIQVTISQIHKDGFLIVDLNELNILISRDFKIPYFIDTDSWEGY
jgi:DNA-binding helix-hairpin-helix protein with protein kinase domain